MFSEGLGGNGTGEATEDATKLLGETAAFVIEGVILPVLATAGIVGKYMNWATPPRSYLTFKEP